MGAIVWFSRIIWYDRHPRLRSYPRGRKVKPHSWRPLPFSFLEISSFGATCSSYSTAHPPISWTGFHFCNSEMPVLSSVCAGIFNQACLQFCTKKLIEFFLQEILWIGKATLSRPRSKSLCVFVPTWRTAFTTPLLKFIFLEFVDFTETWVSGILWSTAYDSRDTCVELSVIKAPAADHASLSRRTWWKVAIAP